MSQIQIPKDWEINTMEKICLDIQPGFAEGQKDVPNGVIHLRMNNISTDFKFNFDLIRTVKPTKEQLEKYVLKKNDVVFNNTNSITLVGKSALFDKDEVFLYSNHLTRLRANVRKVLPQWILLYVQYLWHQRYFEKNCNKWVNQAAFNNEKIKNLEIPIPPLEAQKKIVQKLDYVLGQLEEKKKEIIELSNLEKTQHIISKNIEQLLKTALEGKLTKAWRNIYKTKLESSSILLEQIIRNRRKKWENDQLAKFKAINKKPKDSKWKDKYKEPLLPSPNLPELPDLWTWITLDQITWSVKDGPHYSPEYVDEGIPFISGGNVRPSGVDFVNTKKISPKLHAELSKRCKPEKNDILYTKGGTTGIARVNTYNREFSVWVHIAVLKLVNPIEPFYVQHALNSPFCYSQAQNFTHGVGNQDLGLTRMIRIVLPLPPLEEQLEITKILNQKFLELESVNNKINEIITKKQSIINYVNKIALSVLNEAFSGKLVN